MTIDHIDMNCSNKKINLLCNRAIHILNNCNVLSQNQGETIRNVLKEIITAIDEPDTIKYGILAEDLYNLPEEFSSFSLDKFISANCLEELIKNIKSEKTHSAGELFVLSKEPTGIYEWYCATKVEEGFSFCEPKDNNVSDFEFNYLVDVKNVNVKETK
jgi:hypothetical protein